MSIVQYWSVKLCYSSVFSSQNLFSKALILRTCTEINTDNETETDIIIYIIFFFFQNPS